MWYNVHVGNEQCEKRHRQIAVVPAHKEICLCLFHRAKPVSEMERSGIEHAQRARQTHQRTRQTHSGISRALRNRQTHRVPAGASAGPRKPATQIIRPQTSKQESRGAEWIQKITPKF